MTRRYPEPQDAVEQGLEAAIDALIRLADEHLVSPERLCQLFIDAARRSTETTY